MPSRATARPRGGRSVTDRKVACASGKSVRIRGTGTPQIRVPGIVDDEVVRSTTPPGRTIRHASVARRLHLVEDRREDRAQEDHVERGGIESGVRRVSSRSARWSGAPRGPSRPGPAGARPRRSATDRDRVQAFVGVPRPRTRARRGGVDRSRFDRLEDPVEPFPFLPHECRPARATALGTASRVGIGHPVELAVVVAQRPTFPEVGRRRISIASRKRPASTR